LPEREPAPNAFLHRLAATRILEASVTANESSNRLIYLIHIQKTAGTSIRFYFEKGFGAEKCFWHAPNQSSTTRGNLLNIAVTDPSHFAHFRVIGGHLAFNKIPKQILARSPIFVSALRNPVSRIVSHYQHIRSSPTHGLSAQVAGKTLFQAMKAPGFAAVSDRLQIEYLCGRKDLKSLHDALDKGKYMIGKQEKIDELFRQLSATFGIPVFNDVQVNISKPGYEKEIEQQPDYQKAIEVIREMNTVEFDFYKSFDAVWSNI
jgi:hypothetical protein